MRTRPAASVVPAPLLVLGAVTSVQCGAAIATRLFPAVGPGGTVLLRLAVSALLLLAVARPRLAGRTARDVGTGVVFGLVLAGMNATFYEALDRIPLGVAVTVEFVGPLTVAVAGSRRRLDVLWVALAAAGVALLTSAGDVRQQQAAAGVALLTTAGGHVAALGLLLALVAGGFWGGYILLSQRAGALFPGATGLTVALTVGALAVAPFGILAGGSRLADPSVLWRGAAVAVLSSAVPYSLELAALRRLRAGVFGVLMSLEPAVAALSGLLFLGQHLRLREWVAVGCVMAASLGATRSARGDELPVEPGATPTEMVPV